MPRGGNCNCGQQGGYSEEYFNTEKEEMLGGKKKARRKPRKLSEYNKFMKKEIPIVKKNNPKLSHMEAFKKAASNWKNR